MKQKKLFFLFVLFLITVSTALAQEKEITGTVTDNTGVPLPGVNVLIKGTSNGTQTDFDGNYAIRTSMGQTLVFSFVGMATVEETVGSSDTIDVQMVEDLVNLNEVVVTSLGITREKKSLGYAVTELKSEDINTVKDFNVANSLVGKVAGLTINTSGGLGASSRIVIRGNNSITGKNQALVVVDGIPINSSGESSGGSVYSSSVTGGGITDINPEDIESISVLKGPNAAALYGADAARGVVLITTKKGRQSRGLGVSLTSNTTFDSTMFLPDYQNEYGQGTNGDLMVTGDATEYSLPGGSWGPKLDGTAKPYFTAFDATRPYVAQPDNIKNFFDTGIKTINSIAMDKGGEGFSSRFSYTNTYISSIVPGSSMESHNFNLRTIMNLSDKLTFDSKATYFTQSLDGRVVLGTEGVLNYVYNTPRNVDINDLKNFKFGELGRLTYVGGPNSGWGNPYAILKYDVNDERRNRFLGFAKLNYDFTDWLSAFIRVGSDVTNIRTNRIDQVGHHFFPSGRISIGTIKNTEFNADFLVTAKKDITETLNLAASVGGNLKKSTYEGVYLNGSNFRIPTRPFYENSVTQTANYDPIQTKKVNSLYATVSLAYDDYMYLDITGRNDWSSTLPKSNRSYFYPSVSYSLLADKWIDPDHNFADMIKLRASWAEVGNDTDPYQLASTFSVAGIGYLGLTILSPPSIDYDPNLKSESIKSFEVGFETKFFKNRLYSEFSYYKIKTNDMIFKVPTPSGILYNTNIGEVSNNGVELLVGGIPVMNADFNWDVSLNLSRNKNKVGSLTEGVEEYGFNVTNSGNIRTVARVGGAIGDIFGTSWARDDNGNLLVNADGTPKSTGNADKYLGNANPDWLAGLSNTITYKNFSLRFLIDARFGGEIYSGTSSSLDAAGTSKRSLLYREGGVVVDAINEGTGSANTENISAQQYWGSYSGIAENYVYDQTNIRLREFALNYTVPKTIVEQIGANSATVGVIGHNLFFFYKKADDIDPEGTLGTSITGQGLSSNNVPAIRSVGLNVNLKF